MNAVVEGARESIQVLTSENSAEFYAKRLNLQPEPAPAPNPAADTMEVVEGGETKPEAVESAEGQPANDAEKEAAEQQADTDHPDPEKKQRLNKRFSELSQRIKDAEAKATAEREARELAERNAAELRAKYEPPKTDDLGPEPTRAQFDTDEDFLLAVKDYAGEKAIRDRDLKEAEAKRVSVWTERQKAVKAETPDYDAVIANAGNLMVSNEVRDAILESDAGPKILYHLAKNPEVVNQLNAKSRAGALLMIGRLDAEFAKASPATGKTAPETKPAAAATEVSRAPAPISPLKGNGSTVEAAPVDSNGVFHGSYAQYKQARMAGKIK